MTLELTASGRPRVCAVSYLNTVPLVWGMLHGEQRGLVDLDFCLPAECAERLARGEADVGIVPAVEYARLGLELIPGAGIASRGAVRSILLISKRPLDQIRSLAADAGSRTSVSLARIVLARRYGAEPRVAAHPPDLQAMLAAADAAMIIGDPALRLDPRSLPWVVADLGAEWTAMTGLPMVFAVWASRRRGLSRQLAPLFRDSCRFGLARLEEIAREGAAKRGIGEELALNYLRRHIVFELGEAEQRGLDRFLQYAGEFAMVEPTGKVSA